MILIGDVGGTNTEWVVLENGVLRRFKTIGVNLVHEKLSEFLRKVRNTLEPFCQADQVNLYFAGLLDIPRQRRNALNEIKKKGNKLYQKLNDFDKAEICFLRAINI